MFRCVVGMMIADEGPAGNELSIIVEYRTGSGLMEIDRQWLMLLCRGAGVFLRTAGRWQMAGASSESQSRQSFCNQRHNGLHPRLFAPSMWDMP